MKSRYAKLLSLATLGAVWVFGPACKPAGAQVQPAVPIPAADGGVQTLTQGPIHEAFAEPINYTPTAGDVIPKAPPADINEIPPDERPDGDPLWIPGYWYWDADRNDFIWVSGIWRIPPPDCTWIPGYWTAVTGGWTWSPGFWMINAVQEVQYLPTAPPESLEVGPSSPAPGVDYLWTPGLWVWTGGNYGWRPGYWVQARTDWVWVPACYIWTPRGYIFVEGYWDYVVDRRGVIFAPVYIPTTVYVQPAYVYTPTIVIETNVFIDCLWVSPHHRHYYFGDYYDARYARRGFVPWFDYHHRRHCYDPIYVHERWRRHDDADRWERRMRDDHHRRETNVDARPPRVYSERNMAVSRDADHREYRMATRLSDTAKRDDRRFQRINEEQRNVARDRAREMTTFRDQRNKVESRRDKNNTGSLAIPRFQEQERKAAVDVPSRPEGSRHGRTDRDRQRDVERDRDQQRQRSEGERQQLQQQQERQRIDRDAQQRDQERQRVERDNQQREEQRQRVERDNQQREEQRQRVERDTKQREEQRQRVERENQERQRDQERQRVERDNQQRQRDQERQRVERENQERQRDQERQRVERENQERQRDQDRQRVERENQQRQEQDRQRDQDRQKQEQDRQERDRGGRNR
ncbi:MAG: hypothetical protein ABFD69_16160 [Candidatus Sumerlaeia bacterium]